MIPPLRLASLDTSPPLRRGEEGSEPVHAGTLPHPPQGGEVSPQGDGAGGNRSRRKPGTTDRARQLRQGDNKAEALLWQELKNRKLGSHRFTRQYPIGPYFADFCCRAHGLVVEIDGSQHADSNHDRARDAFMRSLGYSILRFWNTDALKDRRSVCETILAALEDRLAETGDADLKFIISKHSDTDLSA